MSKQEEKIAVVLPYKDKTFRLFNIKLVRNSVGEKFVKISFPELSDMPMAFGGEGINVAHSPSAFHAFTPRIIDRGCEITYHFSNHDSHYKSLRGKYHYRKHIERSGDEPIELMYLEVNRPSEIYRNYSVDTHSITLDPFDQSRSFSVIVFSAKARYFMQAMGEGYMGRHQLLMDDEWKILLLDYKKTTGELDQPPIYIRKPRVATDKVQDKTSDVVSGRLRADNFDEI